MSGHDMAIKNEVTMRWCPHVKFILMLPFRANLLSG